STFRHTRTESRDLDLPLWLHANDRAGLKTLVDEFSLALSGPITLRWEDGPDVWTLDCRHVGGGSITYGEGTTGEKDLHTIVTLRAGDPFWKRTTPQSIGSLTPGYVTFNNAGTAPAKPTWYLEGPLTSFRAIAPD